MKRYLPLCLLLLICRQIYGVGDSTVKEKANYRINPGAIDTTSVEVHNANDPPFLTRSIADTVINEDDSLIILPSGWFNDTDGNIVSIEVSGDTSAVTVISKADFYKLKPAANWYGSALITCSATDDSGATTSVSFRMRVLQVNDPPEFIQTPPDTSLCNTCSLTVNCAPFVHDIDNTTSLLTFSVAVTSGIKAVVRDSLLLITSGECFDTAEAVLTVSDPSGASDSVSFRIFCNKPVPIGTPAPLRKNWTVLPLSTGNLAVFFLKKDTLFAGLYNRYFQKLLPATMLTELHEHRPHFDKVFGIGTFLTDTSSFKVFFLKDCFLFSYKFGYDNSATGQALSLNCFFTVDSLFRRLGKYYPANHRDTDFPAAVANNGSLLITTLNAPDELSSDHPRSYSLQRFDRAMNWMASPDAGIYGTYATLSGFAEFEGAYSIIVYDNKNYFTDTYSSTDRLVSVGKRLFPDQGTGAFSVQTIHQSSAGTLMIYSKRDVPDTVYRTTEGNSLNSLYGSFLGSDMEPAVNAKLICTSSHESTSSLWYCYHYNHTYRIAWSYGYRGMGDPFRVKRRLFDETLEPISETDTQTVFDGIRYLEPRYTRCNDTLFYAEITDSLRNTYGLFRKIYYLFDLPESRAAGNADRRSVAVPEQISYQAGRVIITTTCSGPINGRIIDCRGRVVETFRTTAFRPVTIGKHAPGVYVLSAELNNGTVFVQPFLKP